MTKVVPERSESKTEPDETARRECDAHLADAVRRKVMRLLELIARLDAGTATDDERTNVAYDLLGVYLETANQDDTVPIVHLAQELTERARQEAISHNDDGEPVAVASCDALDAARRIQQECALLDRVRSLDECQEAVEKVRKATRTRDVAWAAGARLYLGSGASSSQVTGKAYAAEKWWGRHAGGKYGDTREARPERRKR